MKAAPLALIGVLAGSSIAIGAEPVRYRTIALSGTAAPGLPSGTVHKTVADPRLDEFGVGAGFWSRLDGGGTTATTDTSFWSEEGSGALLRVREGDPTPAGTGVLLQIATASHQARAVALVAPSGTGALNEVTKLGAYADFGSGFVSIFGGSTAYSPPTSIDLISGGVMYRTDSSSEARIDPMPIVHSGDAAPGTGYANAVFTRIGPPTANSAGDGAFWAMFTGDGLPTAGIESIWAWRGGVLALVATAGDAAPNASGAFLGPFDLTVGIDNARTVTFRTTLTGAATSATDGALIRGLANGSRVLLLREGDSAPSDPTASVTAIRGLVGTSASGESYLMVELGGSATPAENAAVVRFDGSGAAGMALREGDSLGSVAVSTIAAFATAPDGRAAAMCTVTGGGAGPANNEVIIASDIQGAWSTVARMGDAFTLPPPVSDTRIIKRVVFDGAAGSLASGGRVGIRLAFADGTSGLFEALARLCSLDFNTDGFVSGDDFDEFVAAFEAGEADADFNGDGFVNGDDFDEFVVAFGVGC